MAFRLRRLAAAMFVIVGFTTVEACTGIRLQAEDGSVVAARTLEFEVDLHSNVLIVPRGYERQGSTPRGVDGIKWKAKYASIGANGAGVPWIFDGFNEKGLAMGLFYHPGTAEYIPFKASAASKTLAPWELGSWILENFADTQEVKAHIHDVVVSPVLFKAWGFIPPVHYVVHDASGKSIVIEYVKGKLVVYDNPLGVMTNSPTFDWHMTNLRNYINISLTPVKALKLKGVTLTSFGLGAGLHGIPGDFTPPSRFVRAAIFSQSVFTPKTGRDAVLEAFHILNNFDIPKGSAREDKKDSHGNILADYTTWTSASNLAAKRYYFRTYDNSQIRMVDLNKMDLDAKKIVRIPMSGKEVIRELRP